MTKYNLITVLGPTASGKTRFSALLAKAVNGEIISADSRQVYKNMDIGTGKDLADYIVDSETVNYHLIDIHPAGYKYNVFEYQRDFIAVFNKITAQKKLPVLAGGTGMYLEAVLKGYKLLEVPANESLRKELEQKTMDELIGILSTYKALHNNTDYDTKKRVIRAIEIETYLTQHKPDDYEFPKINPLIIGIRYHREIERTRITARLKSRLKEGMIDEVKTLLNKGISSDDLIYYGLEYKYITLFILNQIPYNEMFEKLNTAIHQFAKRQMTWFRRMERNGFVIHWLDGNMSMEDKLKEALMRLEE